VAFFRFSRDKRGYEHFYLVESVTNRKGKSRPRVLYWYRTPPNLKVGRVPFDDEVRRALEARYPGVTFDWTKIAEAPIPSADAEKWRERRRTERAERAAQRPVPADAADEQFAATDGAESDVVESDYSSESAIDMAAPPDSADLTETTAADPAQASATSAAPAAGEASARRRRRRRRGRGEHAAREQSVTEPADSADVPAREQQPPPFIPPGDSNEPSGE
jgi:hypothetical protein